MVANLEEHYCNNINDFPLNKFFQKGILNGKNILILGESPAPNGWRKSGRAFYTQEGKLLPSGKRLNELLSNYHLSVEICAFTEVIKCFVGNNRKLLLPCGMKSWEILEKQLYTNEIKFILSIGVKTLEVINKSLEINLVLGEIQKLQIDNKNYIILPLYHPSPISPIGHKNNINIFLKNEQKLGEIFYS